MAIASLSWQSCKGWLGGALCSLWDLILWWLEVLALVHSRRGINWIFWTSCSSDHCADLNFL